MSVPGNREPIIIQEKHVAALLEVQKGVSPDQASKIAKQIGTNFDSPTAMGRAVRAYEIPREQPQSAWGRYILPFALAFALTVGTGVAFKEGWITTEQIGAAYNHFFGPEQGDLSNPAEPLPAADPLP